MASMKETKRIFLVSYLLAVVVIEVVRSKPTGHNTMADSGSLVRFSPEHQPGCVYNNETYPARHKFKPNPCTYCRCPRHGGRPICAVQDCFSEPSCVKYHKPSDECCGVCIEFGCLHSDGRSYPPGAVISSSSCETCQCPAGGGRTVCSKVTCPVINCVDAVQDAGQCCPRCPNGPNCWHGDQVLPVGVVLRTSTCQKCECPPQPLHHPWNTGARAVCSPHHCD